MAACADKLQAELYYGFFIAPVRVSAFVASNPYARMVSAVDRPRLLYRRTSIPESCASASTALDLIDLLGRNIAPLMIVVPKNTAEAFGQKRKSAVLSYPRECTRKRTGCSRNYYTGGRMEDEQNAQVYQVR